MMPCREFEKHLDRGADEPWSPHLERHLARCPDCFDAASKWRAIVHEIRSIDLENTPERALPLSESTDTLIARVVEDRVVPLRRRGPVRALALAASVALVGAFAAYFVFGQLHTSDPSQGVVFEPLGTASVLIDGEIRKVTIEPDGPPLTTQEDGRALVQLHSDAVGIGHSSRVRIDEVGPSRTRIHLEMGRVVCQVEHRNPGQQFEVHSGSIHVRVVGTRFSVARTSDDGVAVAVGDGAVEVKKDGETWTVRAGNQLRLEANTPPVREPLSEENDRALSDLLAPVLAPEADAIARAEETEDDPRPEEAEEAVEDEPRGQDHPRHGSRRIAHNRHAEMETWRAWILEGRRDEARDALKRHLRSQPRDAKGWTLLADCERKSANWNGAIAAYENVIQHGSRSQKSRAQYRAGTLYQDQLGNHAAASKLFEQYIASGGSMQAEAMVRLAETYVAQGMRQKGIALLERVTREHIGTTAATKAKRLLEAIH